MSNIFQIKRRISGAAGAPSSLKSGELAWNQVDDIVYAGFGDDGSGNATSIVPIAGRGHFAQSSELVSLGYGDMLKSTYDTNDNGKVDVAELAEGVAYANITGLPSEFVPADHDASKISTGIIDAARLPNTVFSKPLVTTNDIPTLTTSEQDDITNGSAVVISDGRVFYYTGTGSKTSTSSYIEGADKTPDWSQISGKPTTFTPISHTHTLSQITDAGTMASQNSGAVSITGGSINNITLDGGTY